jgi:excisionase family DNA binding protein
MSERPAGDDLLTPGGVAALLFVDRKTVSRWAQAGKIPFIRTPGGHRRYLKADVMAIRAGNFNHLDESPPVPLPRSSADRYETLDAAARSDGAAAAVVADAVAIALEAEAAEAAEAVELVAVAVRVASEKAAVAAEKARGAREVAADEAARAVAREAARTATRMRIRADVAAAQVAEAAALAVDQISEADVSREPAESAVLLAETVAAAARATAQDTSRAATVVATAVTTAAAEMARMTSAAEDAYDHEVTTAADALLQLSTETARRVAVENGARAAGVATAAKEAAAALHVSSHSRRQTSTTTPSAR